MFKDVLKMMEDRRVFDIEPWTEKSYGGGGELWERGKFRIGEMCDGWFCAYVGRVELAVLGVQIVVKAIKGK